MAGNEVTPLARAIHEAPDLEARPDLIIRLVELLFLLVPPDREPPPS